MQLKYLNLILIILSITKISGIENAQVKTKHVLSELQKSFIDDIEKRDLPKIAKFGQGLILGDTEDIKNIEKAKSNFPNWSQALITFENFIKFEGNSEEEKRNSETILQIANNIYINFIKNIDALYKSYQDRIKTFSDFKGKTHALIKNDIGQFFQQYNTSIRDLSKKIENLKKIVAADLSKKIISPEMSFKLNLTKKLLEFYEKFLDKIKKDFGKLLPNYNKETIKKLIDDNIYYVYLSNDLATSKEIQNRFYAILDILIIIHIFLINSETKDLLPIFTIKKEGMTPGTIEYFVHEVQDKILGLQNSENLKNKKYDKFKQEIESFASPLDKTNKSRLFESEAQKKSAYLIKKLASGTMAFDIDNLLKKINNVRTYKTATSDAKEILLYFVNKYNEVREKLFKDWNDSFKKRQKHLEAINSAFKKP